MKKGVFLVFFVASLVSFAQLSKISAYSISSINAQKTSTNSAKINWQKDTRSISDLVLIKSTDNSFSQIFNSSCTGTLSDDSLSSCINVTNLPTGLSFVYQVVSNFTNNLNTTNTLGSYTTTQNQTVSSVEYPLVLTTTTETTPTITITPTTPLAPTTLNATISTSTIDGGTTRNYVILQWNNFNTVGTTNSTKIIKYSSSFENEMPMTLNDSTMSSYSDYSVEPGISYNYKIKVCNSDLLCSYSPNISVNIPQLVVETTPNSPQPISISTSSLNSIILNWQDKSTNETSFKIYRSNSTYTTSAQIATTSANVTSYTNSNLTDGNYTYSLSACNVVGCSPSLYFSPMITIKIPTIINQENPTPPVQPTIISLATSTTPGSPEVKTILSWSPVTGATSYKISASNMSGITTTQDNSKVVGTNLIPGTYTFYVSACNGDNNCSTTPAYKSITIPQIFITAVATTTTIEKTATPTGLILATTTNFGGRLSWTMISGLKYNIKNNNNTSIVSNVVSPYNIEYLSTGTNTYYVQACKNSTTDSFSITDNCSNFNSTYITIPEIVTISKPFTPINVLVSILSSYNNNSSVSVSWTDNSINEDTFKINRTYADQSKTYELVRNTQYYTDSGLSSGLYTYNIYACNTSGCSEPLTKSINIAESPSKTLSGTITFPDGKLVIGAKVTAYNTTKSVDVYTDTFGKYSVSLPGGTYTVSVVDGNTNIKSWVVDNTSVVIYDTDKNINFTARPLVSTLKTVVTDELGNPLQNIGVVVGNNDGLRISTLTTDATGNTSTLINAGGYIINTAFSDNLPYIPAERQTASIGNNETKVITFVLKKKEISNTFELRGVTKFDDGILTNAHVSAWSDNGGSRSTYSTAINGEFLLTLSANDTWHISATKDKDGKSYKTTEVLITKNTYTSPISLFFIKNDFESLPQTVSTKTVTTETVKVEATDGAGITLPPNSTNSSGSIDIQVKPTTEAPSQKSAEVVSTVYDITIKNNTGANVTTLSSEAKITLPYDEDELRAQGIIVENLIPSYFDEKIGTWVSVPKFTIDKSKKIFTLYVQHLTRFALIASADTTAPSSPTNIVTDAITPTDVKITWSNPQNDFHHVKIYRSDKLGNYGELIAAEVFSSSFVDKTFSTIAKTYYYTVRAVDAAGNESSNNNQLASNILGDKFASKNKSSTLALPPGQALVGIITRKLSLGSKGDDVTALQRALKIDGFYVTGPITGYYGKLTKNAVTRFQNYYKSELLTPNGYKTGTGIVGPATMKKINEILANNS